MSTHPISACVNCRDDETTIRRWLDVFAPRVKEVIVCDTGSTDLTLDIIRSAPYDNIVLHELPWPGFVAARNRFFDLAGQPFIIQVDADEFLLDEFFDHIPNYIKRLGHGSDSIRLQRYWAEFDFISMDDAAKRAQQFRRNFKRWSYPRDVMYPIDLPKLGVFWVDTDGAEILNNLNTRKFFEADDPLIHCIPAEHKLNNDEYHARKMLAYTRDLGGPTQEWEQFLRRFSPAKIEQMQHDTDADPEDPAPHATWWGRIGHKEVRERDPLEKLVSSSIRLDSIAGGANLHIESTGHTLRLTQADAFIAGLMRKEVKGFDIAKKLAESFKIPLANACQVVTRLEWVLKKPAIDNTVATSPESDAFDSPSAWIEQAKYYREMISETLTGSIKTIVELGVHWGYSLFTLAKDFPEAEVVGVDSFCYPDSENAQAHLDKHIAKFSNTRIIEADTSMTGLAWRDPSIFKPIDILNIDADHSYAGVRADFEAWAPHVRHGGAVLFHDVEAFPVTVGRFFDELECGKKYRRGNLGVWIKNEPWEAIGDNPKASYIETLKRGLTDSLAPSGTLTADEKYAKFEGHIWPCTADTMIGRIRLEDLQHCIENVLRDNIPGDFIETGVWRGGASIFMRGMLKAYGVRGRSVWVADSFSGLPASDPEKYPADAGLHFDRITELAVSLEQVRANFEKHELLDEQVQFLKGWFRDTLPGAPIENLAILRLDGDLYESTMDALKNLYPKLSPGGYVIVDDYWALPACRQAVDDFRKKHDITDTIRRIDWTGAHWRRGKDFQEENLLY